MDFDEIFEHRLGDDDEDSARRHPTWRATVRDGRLKLTGWAPWLADGAPAGKLFRGREHARIAIADLTVAGEVDRELMVRFYSVGRDRVGAEDVILKWAKRVGYRRVWLSDRMVELKWSGDLIGLAEVRCPTCGEHWRDGTPDFWLMVHRTGSFPPWCFLCGSELPQWRVETGHRSASA